MRIPFSFLKSGSPAFDLADLDLTLFVEAPYSTGGSHAWTGNASAGTSGSHHLEVGDAPSGALTLNSLGVADFNGSSNYLVGGGGLTLDDFISTTAYTIFGLAYFDTEMVPAAAYDAPMLFGDASGDLAVIVDATGVSAYHASYTPVTTPCPMSGWHMFFVTYDGTDLKVSIDAAAPTSSARANVPFLLAFRTAKVGVNYADANFLDGKIASLCVSKLDLTASRADIRAYYEDKFALSLSYVPFNKIVSKAFTGLWLPPFISSPWLPTASAGSSGSHGNLAEGSTPPDVMTGPLNGYTGADFNGTDDLLSCATGLDPTMVSESAGSLVCLFYADTAFSDTGSTSFYLAPSLVGTATSRLSMAFSTAGVILGSYDAGWDSISTPCATGGWHLAQARWQSAGLGNIEVRVDSGSWVTTARAVDLVGGAITIGHNYDMEYFDGKIMFSGCAVTRFSDADFDDIVADVNVTFGLTL